MCRRSYVETEGDYIVEGIKINTVTSEERSPEYYFSVDEEGYRDVARGIRDVVASFDFSVRDDRKIMDVYVNENKVRVDTLKNSHHVTISDYIENGDNLVRIEPKNTFDVIEFRLEIG